MIFFHEIAQRFYPGSWRQGNMGILICLYQICQSRKVDIFRNRAVWLFNESVNHRKRRRQVRVILIWIMSGIGADKLQVLFFIRLIQIWVILPFSFSLQDHVAVKTSTGLYRTPHG